MSLSVVLELRHRQPRRACATDRATHAFYTVDTRVETRRVAAAAAADVMIMRHTVTTRKHVNRICDDDDDDVYK